MKYLAMIQARAGSTRLPNKILKDLCGKPQLERVIERVQKSKYVDEVIVITSIDKKNIPVLKLCSEIDIRCGVGSEDDVLDRYYQIAKLIRPEYVIRITGDCPCIDHGLIDYAISELKPDTDYMGMLTESFADGLDIEIFKYSALAKAWKESNSTAEREHVTQYIIKHPELFNQQNFESPIGYFGNDRWTVDEPEDFEVVSNIYNYFYSHGNEDFNYKDILKYLDEHPEIRKINSNFQRNEGLKKSYKNDMIFNNVDAQ